MNDASAQMTPFNPATDWTAPDMSIIRPERPPAPEMSEAEFAKVFGPWAEWIKSAAEVKGAPVDFVALALLSTASAIIGNSRWTVPWDGWKEPPILWGALAGDPSSGKSPGIDAVGDVVKEIDKELSAEYVRQREEWQGQDEIAKLVAAKWKTDAKEAISEGETPRKSQRGQMQGHRPSGVVFASQTRPQRRLRILCGTAGAGCCFQGMNCQGSYRAWTGILEVVTARSGWRHSGGRSYAVDRKNSPEPIMVDHLTVAVLGGIQPDKLDSLLVHGDDDGLLARFLVAYPALPPLRRPATTLDTHVAKAAFERLRALEPITDGDGNHRPFFLHLDEQAQIALQDFRKQCRVWECEASGLMKSHIGKLPGLAVRAATVLALLDYAKDGSDPVSTIEAGHLGRACYYVGEHMRKHAYRAYGVASKPPEVRAAGRIAEIIRAEGLRQISTREIQRRGLAGLQSAKEIGPAFAVLEGADWIALAARSGTGRPAKKYAVNPLVEGVK